MPPKTGLSLSIKGLEQVMCAQSLMEAKKYLFGLTRRRYGYSFRVLRVVCQARVQSGGHVHACDEEPEVWYTDESGI